MAPRVTFGFGMRSLRSWLARVKAYHPVPSPLTVSLGNFARVRRVTGWGADVLPVRLSARELTSVLVLAGLAPSLRTALCQDRP